MDVKLHDKKTLSKLISWKVNVNFQGTTLWFRPCNSWRLCNLRKTSIYTGRFAFSSMMHLTLHFEQHPILFKVFCLALLSFVKFSFAYPFFWHQRCSVKLLCAIDQAGKSVIPPPLSWSWFAHQETALKVKSWEAEIFFGFSRSCRYSSCFIY